MSQQPDRDGLSVIDVSDAIADAMRRLGINGQYDIHRMGSRSTGWVGAPGGTDFLVEVSISPLPPATDDQRKTPPPPPPHQAVQRGVKFPGVKVANQVAASGEKPGRKAP